jgi:circadian clock protein KaiC
LRVEKLRGSHHLNGRHQFAIGSGGITVFPRLEAAFADLAPGWQRSPDRFAIGIPGLDAMLSGGVQGASCTLVLGPPGAGKTLLGLHFLAEGTRRGDRGLWAGFHETPAALTATADQAGLELGPHLESGDVRVMWRPPLELAPDEWAWQLIASIEEHRPQRLVIDAFSDLAPLFVVPERRSFFGPALANTLRDRKVTSMVLMEVDAKAGAAPAHNLSAIVDNGILLRTVERRSSLRRMVSVFKQRQTRFDETIREFTIGAQGIEVNGAFDADETQPDIPSSPSNSR